MVVRGKTLAHAEFFAGIGAVIAVGAWASGGGFGWEAAQGAIKEMCKRAAAKWDIDPEAVTWKDGAAHPAGENAGKFEPMTIKEIAAEMGSTGGPISGHHESTPAGAGPSFRQEPVRGRRQPSGPSSAAGWRTRRTARSPGR